MHFQDVFLAFIIVNVINISANRNDTQVKNFINREIYEEVQQKDEDLLQKKKDREDLQCEDSKPAVRLGGPDACQVKPNSKPWIVSLGCCGGTLIAKNVVLTAAHCLHKCKFENVTLGEHDQKKIEDGEQIIPVKSKKKHEWWNGKQDEYYRYDVGLIFLKQDAILNEKVKLASLPDSNQDCPPGNNLIASGWGADPFILNFNVHILRAVKQGCVDIEKCTIIKPQYRDLALCVGDEKDFRNTIWRGDSGGPLTYTNNEGKTTIFGVVSSDGCLRYPDGTPCPSTLGPTSYARVSYPDILKWIKEGMKSHND